MTTKYKFVAYFSCQYFKIISGHYALTFLPVQPSILPVQSSGLCRIKIVPVVGRVHDLRETLRVCAVMANVTLTLMKYTHAYII